MIYFDNAATTFPKPKQTTAEILKCLQHYCGNPGRGSHTLSMQAARIVYKCRCEIADLLGSDVPENVVFTTNTTYALNIAIKSLIPSNCHILISNFEHNSVLRPIHQLSYVSHNPYSVFDATGSDDQILESIQKNCRKNTRAIVMTQASNICNRHLPIEKIGEFCHSKGYIFIIDGAQGAGLIHTDLKKCHADAYCAPGHKGLYGPQGCGFILYADKYRDSNGSRLSTLMEGGNGILSQNKNMSDALPERLEAGTLPTPCIAGLCEGIRQIKEIGISYIAEYENSLYARAFEILKNIAKVTTYGDMYKEGPILLFNINDIPSDVVASELDKYEICTRSGLHCAPLAHQALDTGKNGAIRISFSMFNTIGEIDLFGSKLLKIIASLTA